MKKSGKRRKSSSLPERIRIQDLVQEKRYNRLKRNLFKSCSFLNERYPKDMSYENLMEISKRHYEIILQAIEEYEEHLLKTKDYGNSKLKSLEDLLHSIDWRY